MMDARIERLGFRPQREIPYNKLLPYADKIDEESNAHLAEIKAQLGRTIQMRDIKIGASHWCGQLTRYIRLHGHKYSREDHVTLIHLLYELTTMPDLELSLVTKFAQVLHTLLKKRELLSRDDLVLPWRPLYKTVENTIYNPYEHNGLQLIPVSLENTLKCVCRVARVYFSLESTQEILDEFRPLMCLYDVTMLKAMLMFELFLPTTLPPEHHQWGFKLWFDEFMALWDNNQLNTQWEPSLVNLLARLASENIGYIDWEPYIPKIFTRVLRSFNLPVLMGGINYSHTLRMTAAYHVLNITLWITSMIGGGSSTQEHISKLFKAVESFYHPSNVGKWNLKLQRTLFRLPHSVVKRVHRERYLTTWETPVPKSHQLTDQDITAFVESIKPVVFLAMFSKTGSHDSAVALERLAVLRPEIIIPSLLEKTYPALETVIEPHRLISCLNCTVFVARSMLNSQRWYPEGRSHVIPLLNLCLPGIDPNDWKKCLTTFQLISSLASFVPIADCTEALQCRSDLTEEERELCSQSAQFEDFVLLFMDKLFLLIENSSSEHPRTDSTTTDKLNPEEMMLEVGMLSTFNAIMQQSSLPIYKEALKKLFRFVSTNIYELRVAGRFSSDLCRAAAKAHPELALKMFVPEFCNVIITRTANEDLTKEEQLDNEFLWNLKHLSEMVRCDGRQVLAYKDDIVKVLHACLYLQCKDATEQAGNLLRHTLKALTLTYATDYRSSPDGCDKPFTEHFPIQDWGKPGDMDNLGVKWHVMTPEEKQFATWLLQEFLIPQLERIGKFIEDASTMTREELRQCLNIVVHCILGAGSTLPMWSSEPVKLIDCMVDLKRFPLTVSEIDEEITVCGGQNVRQVIVNTLQPLLSHMLANHEDDTKSLLQVVKVYQSVLFYQGTQKDDFDNRWKSLRVVKRSMENQFLGKKRHIRAVLVDRVQLQHELRITHHISKIFTKVHADLFHDLFRLSISRYSEVRKSAQQVLLHGLQWFPYSNRVILDEVVAYIKNDPNIEHHQFKGALYVVLGYNHKASIMNVRNWDVMQKVWPALVRAQHSEKPSILKLVDSIMDKLHRLLESTDLSIVVTDTVIEKANQIWASPTAHPSLPMASGEEIQVGKTSEEGRNSHSLQAYLKLIDTLVGLVNSGTLHWRFHQMALEMLALISRHDCKLPPNAVELFISNIVSDTLQVRKICIGAVSSILKQQKRKHVKVVIDPYKVSGTSPPAPEQLACPGDRPDNMWHHYNSDHLPKTQELWDQTVFVEKTHWGFYSWPREMKVYAPVDQQPPLSRAHNSLSEEEKPIYNHFMDPSFIEKFIGFLSLEENKAKDKFHTSHFTLFKGLFRNYDDTFLHLLRPHVERLVADTQHDTHETSHRCAAEIIAGLIRGSKHWTFSQVQQMWSWLVPAIKTALTNMTVESVSDWGTCFATSAESRDPRKLYPLFELLMDDPLKAEAGSFTDASRLYVLQGALAQQEWRVPELLHRLLEYLKRHLTHPYKNVRDRIGSVLVNVFVHDFTLPYGSPTTSPHQGVFMQYVLPLLEILKNPVSSGTNPESTNGMNKRQPMAVSGMDSTISFPSAASRSNDVQLGMMGAGSRPNINIQSLDQLPPALREQILSQLPPGVNIGTRMQVTESSVDSPMMMDTSEPDKEEEGDARATAVRLCKTVIKFIQGGFNRILHFAPPEIFQFLSVLCMITNETKDTELKKEALAATAAIAQAMVSGDLVPQVIQMIKEVSESSSWHARAAILGFTQIVVFCNLFNLQDPAVISQIRNVILNLLCDDQLEVREAAAITLGGFLHCDYLTLDKSMMDHFEKLSRTKVKKKQRKLDSLNGELLIKRHAGVLGMSACVQAYPYDVPQFVPQLLMDLSDHLDDPQPIQMTVKKTLSDFRRTHHDNWIDHKQKFTDDQLVVLTDLLVSPNYYA